MFVYIQSILIMMLEILCCKFFFEAFGIKKEENNCWKNYSIVIGLTVLCYFIAMIFRYYFIVKQVFSIILIAFFMLLYLKLSFGKALILSALFESLLLVMDYFALLMNIFIFHNMEEVWESHVITAMIKMSEDIKKIKPRRIYFCYSVWIGGNEHSCILFNI